MTGLRLIDAMPETFRFPEWRDDIYYVADSVVRFSAEEDSELVSRFYVAKIDVPPTSGAPYNNPDYWITIVNSLDEVTVALDSDTIEKLKIYQLFDFDSDVDTLINVSSWDYGSFGQ